jgi:hypothetical protein
METVVQMMNGTMHVWNSFGRISVKTKNIFTWVSQGKRRSKSGRLLARRNECYIIHKITDAAKTI